MQGSPTHGCGDVYAGQRRRYGRPRCAPRPAPIGGKEKTIDTGPGEKLDQPLPEAVRQRVVEAASEVVGSLRTEQVPAPLRRVARFEPRRRARLAATPIAAQLEKRRGVPRARRRGRTREPARARRRARLGHGSGRRRPGERRRTRLPHASRGLAGARRDGQARPGAFRARRGRGRDDPQGRRAARTDRGGQVHAVRGDRQAPRRAAGLPRGERRAAKEAPREPHPCQARARARGGARPPGGRGARRRRGGSGGGGGGDCAGCAPGCRRPSRWRRTPAAPHARAATSTTRGYACSWTP